MGDDQTLGLQPFVRSY